MDLKKLIDQTQKMQQFGGGQQMNEQQRMDQKINEQIQKREIEKARTAYFGHLRQYHSARKYREIITLGCAKPCLGHQGGFVKDDLTRSETQCLTQCFHKYYRYLAYSNSLYTYLTSDEREEIDAYIDEDEDGLAGEDLT